MVRDICKEKEFISDCLCNLKFDIYKEAKNHENKCDNWEKCNLELNYKNKHLHRHKKKHLHKRSGVAFCNERLQKYLDGFEQVQKLGLKCINGHKIVKINVLADTDYEAHLDKVEITFDCEEDESFFIDLTDEYFENAFKINEVIK